jgi:YVTN family beta-propeller protein
MIRRILAIFLLLLAPSALQAQRDQHYLYVAAPSDTADVDYSIHVFVFDVANGHRLVKRLSLWQPSASGEREIVRGMAVSAKNGRLIVSTTRRLASMDLSTGRLIWERSYEDHCCDRIALSPDGQTIYAPAFGSPKWYVVRAESGELRATVGVTGWPREARYSPDGQRVYLAPWESDTLSVADAATHQVIKTIGPFSGFLCPFTLNAKGTLAFANVDGMVGFEVGDLQTGLILDSVEVEGVAKELAAGYECPSHGIAFAAGERELWIADGVRNRLHVFDASVYPPVPSATIDLAGQPRWIAFSGDGRYAYPSTGDVVDATSKKIVGALQDETGAKVSSEVIAGP